MRQIIAILLLIFISALVPGQILAEETDVAEKGLKEEVEQLRENVQQMQQQYEHKLQQLERKMEQAGAEDKTPARGPVSTYGGILNPDISIVVNADLFLSDDKANDNRNKVRVREAEIILQGMLYPGIQGDFIVALEQEYEGGDVETEADVEEAFLSFLELPLDFSARAGRMFLDFGKMNKMHQHFRPFADTPLVLENLFGEHEWFDDGAELSLLIPNPLDLYLKAEVGYFNGRNLEHGHEEEEGEEEHEFGEESIDWQDNVYLSRLFLNIPATDDADLDLGYSVVWDEGSHTAIHCADLTFKYRWPLTYRRFLWQNEFFLADVDERDVESVGFYSLLKLTLNKYWEFGGRLDWSEFADNDDLHEWGGTGFITYHLTESTYIRGQYRYTDLPEGNEENAGFIQFVWGLGPHSHRLED